MKNDQTHAAHRRGGNIARATFSQIVILITSVFGVLMLVAAMVLLYYGMTPFDLATLMAAACGLVMIFGAMTLLGTGKITLKNGDGSEATRIELKKTSPSEPSLSIIFTSPYPTLFLFVFGLVFSCASLYFGSFANVPKWKVHGKLVGDGIDSATISVVSTLQSSEPLDSDGTITEVIRPEVDRVDFEIAVPGHLPEKIRKRKTREDVHFGVVSLGDLPAGVQVETKLLKNQDIDPNRPAGLAPLEQGGLF